MKNKLLLLLLSTSVAFSISAQNDKLLFSAYDGYVVLGYVDQGAFLNFTGPNMNYAHNHSKFVIGMLPSLRFKQDVGATRNSFVTPNLGIGLTYSYKVLAFQLPFYYNPKTSTSNGKWHIGIGIGLRMDEISKKYREKPSP